MPTFDYRCEVCDKVEEIIVPKYDDIVSETNRPNPFMTLWILGKGRTYNWAFTLGVF